MNEYQEKALFQRFKNTYKNFPATLEERIDDQDQPDIIVKTGKNRKIGIELTSMYQDNENSKSSGSNLKKIENIYQRIGNSIVAEVAKHSSEKFHLDITFHRNVIFRQQNRQKIIKELASLIIKYLPILEPRKPLVVSDFKKLPKDIIDFCIFTSPDISKSYFGNSQSAAIRDLSNNHVDTVLKDKDKAIENYEKCDEHWLVIKIGHFVAGSFDKNRINKSFKSEFDKIFIYDIQTSEILELSIQK